MDPRTAARLRLKASTSSFESDSSYASAQSFHTVAGSLASQYGDHTPTQDSFLRSSIYRRRGDPQLWGSDDDDQEGGAVHHKELNLDDLEISLSTAGPPGGLYDIEHHVPQTEEHNDNNTDLPLPIKTRDYHIKDFTITPTSHTRQVISSEAVEPANAFAQPTILDDSLHPFLPLEKKAGPPDANQGQMPAETNHSAIHRPPPMPISEDHSSPARTSAKNTQVRPRSRRLSAPERMSVTSASFDRPPVAPPSQQDTIPTPRATITAEDIPVFHTSLASTSSGDQSNNSDLTLHKTFSHHHRRESTQTTNPEVVDPMDEMRYREPLQPSAQHYQSMLTTGVPPSLMQMSMDLHQPSYPVHHDYRQGVVFEYYEGEWEWLPNFDEMRPANVGIVGNFLIEDTTETEIFRPKFRTKPSGPPGNFAVRFTTNIDIRQDGVYTFWLSSNDGSTLYIANQLVVENDGTHYATEAEGRIMLTVGRHPMLVEFFHKNGKMLEGFRSSGPSLSVYYRPPGPIWSFGLTLGPKQVIKSMNLFYDHGDLQMVNLLNKFNQDQCLDPRMADDVSVARLSHDGSSCYSPQIRPNRQWLMSGSDTVSMQQPSTREMFVQMENAKATIKDLEQIIRDQAQSHQKRMDELYAILQDTMAQRNRLVQGLKQAQVFHRPWPNPSSSKPQAQSQSHSPSSGLTGMMASGSPGVTSSGASGVGVGGKGLLSSRYQTHSSWRNTVASVYVDAQEGHSGEDDDDDNEAEAVAAEEEQRGGPDIRSVDNNTDQEPDPEDDQERVDLYFFSMALSVKMNTQMKLNSQQQIIQASQESESAASTSVPGSGSVDGSSSVYQGSGGTSGGSSSSSTSGPFTSFLSRTFTSPPKSDKQTPPATTTSLQKLYEDCCTLKIPVENWPAYVSRTLGVAGLGGPEAPLSVAATNMSANAMPGYPLFGNGRGGGVGGMTAANYGGRGGRMNPGAAVAATTTMPVFVIL
ncbi:hypothetical protein DFQ27_000168 [Actinomortierella ambigua]|uniref:PA14 domain-containing protein n=1 Tax=Actinomortierella ambigua TaxID=1343610 RepID=A0A9P6QGJ1_9FUNG|nr:hypothetical protein DFQ27_000168 [Actinomortierella ambigua]